MLCAGGGEFVDADAAVCRRDAPLRFHKLLFEETLQRGIQGAFFDLKEILRSSFDELHEGVTVQGLTLQHAENHHFECAGKEIAWNGFGHEGGFFSKVRQACLVKA